MNPRLKAFAKDNFPEVKTDLFSMFFVRNTELALPKGELGFVTPYVWMFISSYEKMRSYVLAKTTITSLIQLEYNAFAPACIPVSTFTVTNASYPELKGGYIRLSDFRGAENQGPKTLEAIKNYDCGWFYHASSTDFKKIPGSPIVYWVSDKISNCFLEENLLGDIVALKAGLSTGDNALFQKSWYEISKKAISFM